MDKFPVVNKTALKTDLEKDIANRLLTGFENWNRGFEAWKAWGSILYTEDSIYNVHGARLTLPEYQAPMVSVPYSNYTQYLIDRGFLVSNDGMDIPIPDEATLKEHT